MNIVIGTADVPEGRQAAFLEGIAAAHKGLEQQPGFRWAMVMRPQENPSRLAAAAMWLTLEQAGEPEFPARRYDVATARGSMTPAAAAALVEWQPDEQATPDFVNRWNAAYHAIEDAIGSRLLRDLDGSGRFTALHVAANAAALTPATLGTANSDAGGDTRPSNVELFEVLFLNEA